MVTRNGVRIRWAVDVQATRAAAARARWGADRDGTDYRGALADPEVDAVSLCLPHDLHAPVAIAAARAGKHVLVEKPLADSLAAADAAIAAAEEAGVVLMVAENVRFNPLFQRIRELLEAQAIGKPATFQLTRECYLTRSIVEDRPWFLKLFLQGK